MGLVVMVDADAGLAEAVNIVPVVLIAEVVVVLSVIFSDFLGW